MKKFFIPALALRGLFAAALFLCALPAAAQENMLPERPANIAKAPSPNRAQLSAKADKMRAARAANIQLARRLAAERGWPVQLDGAELVGVTRDTVPVYYETSNNRHAARTISTDDLHPGGETGLDLTGDGFYLGEWDSGPARLSHQEFEGRVRQADNVPYDECDRFTFHATHVAGTLVGAGIRGNARGMAYEANLDAYDWDFDTEEMTEAAADGLLISNHSYGRIAGWYFSPSDEELYWFGNPQIDPNEDVSFGLYDEQAQAWDELARLAPYYLIVKAAGNDRTDRGPDEGETYLGFDGNTWTEMTTPRDPDGPWDCISTYGTAKNILTVGAVHDLPDGWANPEGVEITGFSSFGPTDDGRIKPDICGNGHQLLSADCAGDDQYQAASGTSMAAPNVSGSLLLLQQHHYQTYENTFMRAATLKGLVLHTADEAGDAPGPDYRFGWGLMNTRKAADVISRNGAEHHLIEGTLLQGETITYRIVPTGDGPLTATISWTDLPGRDIRTDTINNRAPKLVNDLDLRLLHEESDTTYRPWTLDPERPGAPAETGDNFRDNVERIDVAEPEPGVFILTVTHKGELEGGPQDFALIISGATMETLVCEGPKLREAASGALEDGSGEALYEGARRCVWQIRQPNGLPLGVAFSKLEIGEGDVLRLYDGDSFESPLLAELTGSETPGVLRAASGALTVIFETDEEGGADGWAFDYFTNYCSGLQTETRVGGTVLDGSGNDRDYAPHSECAWLLDPPGARNVEVEIEQLELAPGDTLFLYEGADANGPVIAALTEDSGPGRFVAEAPEAYLRFTTDGALEAEGWALRYRPGPFCGNDTLNVAAWETGVLSDGSDEAQYQPLTNCSWLFVTEAAEPDRVFEINFTKMDTEERLDVLRIYDGPTSDSPLLGAFSGTSLPETGGVSTFNDSVFVTFRSDNSKQLDGWEFEYGVVVVSRAEAFGQLEGVALYPNPAREAVSLRWLQPEDASEMRLRLTDLAGKTLRNSAFGAKPGNNEIRIETAGLASGVYFAELIAGDRRAVAKLVIQR